MATPTVTITEPTGNAMYCHYDRQTYPQPAYIELDPEDNTMMADCSGETGNGIPFDVYHGRRMWYSCPVLTDAGALNLMRELLPLAERVCAGYSCEWDGNNHIGQLTDDATAANEEIERMCAAPNQEELEVWGVDDWLDGETSVADGAITIARIHTITPDTTDEQLEAMADAIDNDAASDNILLGHPDAIDYLTELRDGIETE